MLLWVSISFRHFSFEPSNMFLSTVSSLNLKNYLTVLNNVLAPFQVILIFDKLSFCNSHGDSKDLQISVTELSPRELLLRSISIKLEYFSPNYMSLKISQSLISFWESLIHFSATYEIDSFYLYSSSSFISGSLL